MSDSTKKEPSRWEVMDTLRADETAPRSVALQFSIKSPLDTSKSLIDNVSLTTGFWRRKEGKFFPTVHFAPRYSEELAILFVTAHDIVMKIERGVQAAQRVRKMRESVTPVNKLDVKDVESRKLTATIGDMLKAKGE